MILPVYCAFCDALGGVCVTLWIGVSVCFCVAKCVFVRAFVCVVCVLCVFCVCVCVCCVFVCVFACFVCAFLSFLFFHACLRFGMCLRVCLQVFLCSVSCVLSVPLHKHAN